MSCDQKEGSLVLESIRINTFSKLHRFHPICLETHPLSQIYVITFCINYHVKVIQRHQLQNWLVCFTGSITLTWFWPSYPAVIMLHTVSFVSSLYSTCYVRHNGVKMKWKTTSTQHQEQDLILGTYPSAGGHTQSIKQLFRHRTNIYCWLHVGYYY